MQDRIKKCFAVSGTQSENIEAFPGPKSGVIEQQGGALLYPCSFFSPVSDCFTLVAHMHAEDKGFPDVLCVGSVLLFQMEVDQNSIEPYRGEVQPEGTLEKAVFLQRPGASSTDAEHFCMGSRTTSA